MQPLKLVGYVGVEGAGWLDHGFQAPICHGATVYVTSVPENHAKDKICFDQRSVSNETVYEQSWTSESSKSLVFQLSALFIFLSAQQLPPSSSLRAD